MSLRQMFPAGQLPDKFSRVREVPVTKKQPTTTITTPGINERNVSALIRFARTMAKPDEAFSWEVLALRTAIAAHGSCPDCGASMYVDTHAEVIMQAADEREGYRRSAPVAFCSACECSIEMPEVQR